MKNNIKDNENIVNKETEIRASQHFAIKYMERWNWDYTILKDCLQRASIEKVGKNKYEATIWRKGSKKVIFVVDEGRIFVISGAEGT